MASRNTLKASFSAGQSVVESDFSALIDSLAHLTDDVASGALASGSDITTLNASVAALQSLTNTTKSELDSYVGTHPTLAEVQTADATLSNTLNANITALANSSQSADTALQSSLSSLEGSFNSLFATSAGQWNTLGNAINAIPSTYATIESLATSDNNISALVNTKAPLDHTHSEYLTSSDISSFITASDIPISAPLSHVHTASEVSGLYDLFMTPVETQSMISANATTISHISQLYDTFYDKDEVDQKLHVWRLRTDQVSLFTPAVVSISQPLVDLAKQELEVSIFNVNYRVTTHRTHEDGEFSSVRASIGNLTNNLRASIGVTRTDAFSAISNLRADVGTYDSSTLSSANQYTDDKIDDLLNGAGDAYDTLKELQTIITSNDSDAALALSTQVSLLQADITSNDADIVTFQNNLNAFQTNYDNLTNAHTAITNAYNELLQRVETLENTAYAEAGYVFPNSASPPVDTSYTVVGTRDGETYSLTSTSLHVTEGTSVTFDLETTGVAQGTSLDFYLMEGVREWGIDGQYPTGSFIIGADGKADSVTFTPLEDQVEEGAENAAFILAGAGTLYVTQPDGSSEEGGMQIVIVINENVT